MCTVTFIFHTLVTRWGPTERHARVKLVLSPLSPESVWSISEPGQGPQRHAQQRRAGKASKHFQMSNINPLCTYTAHDTLFISLGYAVNSLMLMGLMLCVFETKRYSQELIFMVSPDLINISGICIWNYELCLLVFIFAISGWSWNLPNKSLANINEFIWHCMNHYCNKIFIKTIQIPFTGNFLYYSYRSQYFHGTKILWIGAHIQLCDMMKFLQMRR